MVLTCFVLIIDSLLDIFNVFIIAIFNQRIILGFEEYSLYLYAYYPLIIAFFLSILNGIFFSVWRWSERKSMDMLTSFLLRESVKKTFKIDYASYDDHEYYDQIQKGWAQDGRMFISSASTVFKSISSVIGMWAYISVFAYIDWRLMIFITVLRILLNPFINKVYNLGYHFDNQLAELRRKEQYYRDFFSNKGKASDGKLFDLYEYAEDNYFQAHREIYRSTFIHKLRVNSINLLAEIIHNLPLVIGYVYLSICVFYGTVNLADVTLFISMYAGFVDHLYNTIGNFSGFRIYAEQSHHAM